MHGEARIYLGTIVEVKGALVKVQYTDTQSDFVPYLQTASGFKTHFTPPQVDEVVVLFKLGKLGFVLGSILPTSLQSQIDTQSEVITYEDGTSISYKNGVIEIKSLKELNIKCTSAKIEADSIELGGEGALGVVTGACVCAFTGAPHADVSLKVKAAK